MTPSVYTPSAPRNPSPSIWPTGPRDWKPPRKPPHRPTAEGEHYLRPLVAGRVKELTSAGWVHGALQTHLEVAKEALMAMEHVGAALLGRETAGRLYDALKAELRKSHPRLIEGNAVAFCAALGVKVGVDAASAALRLVLAGTPILRREGRFLWVADLKTLKACRPGDMRLEAVLSWPSKSAVNGQQGAALSGPQTTRESECDRTRSREHACAVVSSLEYSAADENRTEAEHPGGLGGASAPPAERAGASTATSAASDGDAPLTFSSFLQALPRYRRQVQAIELIRQASPIAPAYPSARAAAQDLLDIWAGRSGQTANSRDVEAVTRAMSRLQARGDLRPGFALPAFALHPWLVILGVKPRPSAERPTSGQVRYLRGRGINPAGLSRGEARAMQAAIQKRAQEGLAWPRQMQRFIARHGWGWRVDEACAAGRIDGSLAGSLSHLRGLTVSAYLSLMEAPAGMVH